MAASYTSPPSFLPSFLPSRATFTVLYKEEYCCGIVVAVKIVGGVLYGYPQKSYIILYCSTVIIMYFITVEMMMTALFTSYADPTAGA